MTRTREDTVQETIAQTIMLTAATYAMESFVAALAARGESYVALYVEDDGASVVAALEASSTALADAVSAEINRARDANLRGADIAPRIRDRAQEHGARVAAEFLIARGRAVS